MLFYTYFFRIKVYKIDTLIRARYLHLKAYVMLAEKGVNSFNMNKHTKFLKKFQNQFFRYSGHYVQLLPFAYFYYLLSVVNFLFPSFEVHCIQESNFEMDNFARLVLN